MNEFENFDICCPKQLGDTEIWKTKLEYEQSEIMNEVNQKMFVLNLFSQELRLSTLFNLSSRPHCVCELVEKLNVRNSLVSYHISLLEQNKLIERVTQGGYTFLKITSKGKMYLNWIKSMPWEGNANYG
jgi:DNA-binding transcriptional ArsR family regulator